VGIKLDTWGKAKALAKFEIDSYNGEELIDILAHYMFESDHPSDIDQWYKELIIDKTWDFSRENYEMH
tara:strand:+ start:697 stop:900 length:204 start_codon:yes stop_codon:yes gene_type:complete